MFDLFLPHEDDRCFMILRKTRERNTADADVGLADVVVVACLMFAAAFLSLQESGGSSTTHENGFSRTNLIMYHVPTHSHHECVSERRQR